MIARRVTPAPESAFALADLKHNCRVESEDEDAFIGQLGEAAATYIERITGRFFGGGTVALDLPHLPGRFLPPSRFGRVTGIVYRDEAHAQITMADADYVHDGIVLRILSEPLPRTATRPDAATFTFNVTEPWPSHLVRAGAMMVTHWHDARTAVRLGADGVIGAGELPLAFSALVSAESITGL